MNFKTICAKTVVEVPFWGNIKNFGGNRHVFCGRDELGKIIELVNFEFFAVNYETMYAKTVMEQFHGGNLQKN